jgi:glycosyltransferase involved in cell wall biosynthesis
MSALRVAIVCDLVEEGWPSMDLVAERLFDQLALRPDGVELIRLRPRMRRRFTRIPGLADHPHARIGDRLANRYFDYPRWLASQRECADVFHVIDHSYAHLVHTLPPGKTVVTCHDLDAFRCLLHPADEPRSAPFRSLVRRTLTGLQQAARIACVSEAVRNEISAADMIPAARLRVVPNGADAASARRPDPEAAAAAFRLLGPMDPSHPELLHVGSTIPRKRIDVLLRAFAGVRARRPGARLIRVGGLTEAQRRLAAELGVLDGVVETPFLDRPVLEAVYARAVVMLLPSDREGFGMTIVESLAAGVPAVVSDLPSLRETGGEAALYCPPGDADAFANAVLAILDDARTDRRTPAVAQASRFSWASYAAHMSDIYREIG